MRAILHYVSSILILSVYGGEVCPAIASLGIPFWLGHLSVAFAVVYALRHALQNFIVWKAPAHQQSARRFVLEFSLYVFAAAALAAYNTLVYKFPFDISGMKIVVGCLILGFFTAADLVLDQEKNAAVNSNTTLMPRDDFFPLTRKFSLASCIILLSLAGVLFMVVARDLQWLATVPSEDIPIAAWLILKELGWVTTVFLGATLNLVSSYARNMKLLLHAENRALRAVAGGDFRQRVPVGTHDEFGVMAHYTNHMIASLEARTRELDATRLEVIYRLCRAAEHRDNETGMHVQRMSHYSAVLARAAGLNSGQCRLILHASPLHDVGKIGIPDPILLKPGKLSPEEFEIMQQHVRIGGEILAEGDSELIRTARDIALTHHEKWDGTGYPSRLQGENIPFAGRIVAICDVFDALTSERPYKHAWPIAQAVEHIESQAGRQFDPRLVKLFKQILPEILNIRRKFMDEGHAPVRPAVAGLAV